MNVSFVEDQTIKDIQKPQQLPVETRVEDESPLLDEELLQDDARDEHAIEDGVRGEHHPLSNRW